MSKLVWTLPLLAAAAPVLSLVAHNVDELDLGQVAPPLLVAAVGAAVLLAIVWLFSRDLLKSALVATVLVILFFGYGRFYHWVWTRRMFDSMLVADIVVGGLTLGLTVWTVRGILRTRRNLEPLARFLNIVALLVVCFSSIQTIIAAMGSRPATARQNERPAPSLVETAATPDIYYIILDGYARADILDKVYGFDNSEFLEALRQRGFYVADASASNYSMTFLSLASSLGMKYLDEEFEHLAATRGPDSKSHDPFYRIIRAPVIAGELQARGYRYVTTQTNWSGTERSAAADVVYPYASFLGGEFTAVLLRTTLLRNLAPSVAQMHRFTFAKLREIPRLAGPTFAFVHCLLPHNPYVFDRHGNERTNIPLSLQWTDKTGGWDNREGYVEQLTFLNHTMIPIIDDIIAASEVDPVIIIQADHGSAATRHKQPGRRPVPWERMAILNAFRVSDAMKAKLYPTITPVNTFRLLLSTYFGAAHELLPDRSYYGWYGSSFRTLKDVTAELEVGEAPWLEPAPAARADSAKSPH